MPQGNIASYSGSVFSIVVAFPVFIFFNDKEFCEFAFRMSDGNVLLSHQTFWILNALLHLIDLIWLIVVVREINPPKVKITKSLLSTCMHISHFCGNPVLRNYAFY